MHRGILLEMPRMRSSSEAGCMGLPWLFVAHTGRIAAGVPWVKAMRPVAIGRMAPSAYLGAADKHVNMPLPD